MNKILLRHSINVASTPIDEDVSLNTVSSIFQIFMSIKRNLTFFVFFFCHRAHNLPDTPPPLLFDHHIIYDNFNKQRIMKSSNHQYLPTGLCPPHKLFRPLLSTATTITVTVFSRNS